MACAAACSILALWPTRRADVPVECCRRVLAEHEHIPNPQPKAQLLQLQDFEALEDLGDYLGDYYWVY